MTTGSSKKIKHSLLSNWQWAAIILVQFIVLESVHAQTGRPFISNYAPITYASNSYASGPQNWCIGQVVSGKLIISNTDGILVFDGADWQMIPGTEDKRMLKFAEDKNGQIFTGGIGEIGVLKANENGKLEYQSLLDQLNEDDRNFDPIVNVVSYNGDVYFRSSKRVFRYSNGTFKTWKSESGFLKLVSSSAGLFVSEKSNWFKLENDALSIIASSTEKALPGWSGVFQGNGDTLIISTTSKGIYKLKDSQLSTVENYLSNFSILNGCEIASDKFALATEGHGVIIINNSGTILDVIDESVGLSSNLTYFPFYKDGKIWVGLSSGISSIEYPIQVSVLDKNEGLKGIPYRISSLNGKAFIGTSSDAFWLNNSPTNQGTLIATTENINQVFGAIKLNNSLFVGSPNGLSIINENNVGTKVLKLSQFGCTGLLKSSKFDNFIYAAFKQIIIPIRFNQKSEKYLYPSIDISHEVYDMAEDSNGNLWAVDDGISYINFSAGFDNPEVLTLNESNGFIAEMGYIQVSNVNNKIVFGTDIGAYSFDHKTKKLIPNEIFGKEFCDGSTMANNITQVRNGDVWITTDRQTGLLRKQKNDTYNYDSLPIIRVRLSGVWDIYEDDKNIVWIASNEGIVRYDPNTIFDNKAPYKAFIRNVIINDKDKIFSGNYSDKNGLPTTKQPDSYIPTLEYERNSIAFKFGAGYYTKDVKLEYSVKLEGKDSEWSSWRASSEMSYNNLREGRYTFKVRSRNVYGNISQEAAYSFEILPPWYRTTWAYILFIVGGLLFLYLIVKLNSIRLKRENIKLEGVITERTAEVRQQKERAEQSEAFKQQFLANMSHEIRTPMNAVMGMTNLVLDTPLQPKQKDYMEGIKKSSDILLHIINDILDLSKIEAGKMELEEIDFSISDFIDQIKKTLQHRASDKGLELMVSIKPNVEDIVLGDPVRLNQILINLTGNAIKFTEKGSVAVEITKVEQGIKFAIIDTGVGIPKDKLETVFENFSQANASDTRKFGGTGLGLSISRQLVELMGGGISIESEEGSGTTFSFIVDFKIGSKENLDKRMAAEGNVDGTILDGLKILVTDDNEFNRIVARDTLLSKANVEIFEAENGQEAIDILKANEIDVVLMDVQMPVMNGYEATRTIRAFDSAKKDIPIIALTASVVRTDLDKCRKAGMNAYIPKPFKTSDLITGIADALNIELRVAKEEIEDMIEKETIKGGVTDLAYLTDFCDGDRTKMKKYVDMFTKGVGKLETQIDAAIENKDDLGLADQVHGFNTKFIMMGMKETKSLSVAIENKLRDEGTIQEVIDNVELLRSDIISAVEELSHFKAN
jgi:signal transduction histidine kinase/CheY-like chemotaxis protein